MLHKRASKLSNRESEAEGAEEEMGRGGGGSRREEVGPGGSRGRRGG